MSLLSCMCIPRLKSALLHHTQRSHLSSPSGKANACGHRFPAFLPGCCGWALGSSPSSKAHGDSDAQSMGLQRLGAKLYMKAQFCGNLSTHFLSPCKPLVSLLTLTTNQPGHSGVRCHCSLVISAGDPSSAFTACSPILCPSLSSSQEN